MQQICSSSPMNWGTMGQRDQGTLPTEGMDEGMWTEGMMNGMDGQIMNGVKDGRWMVDRTDCKRRWMDGGMAGWIGGGCKGKTVTALSCCFLPVCWVTVWGRSRSMSRECGAQRDIV